MNPTSFNSMQTKGVTIEFSNGQIDTKKSKRYILPTLVYKFL